MRKAACRITKNPCKICFQSVTKKTGVQCCGACQKWVHFQCINYTPGKIKDIKNGVIKIMCPCPDCSSEPKEILVNPPYTCGNHKCPANNLPKCEDVTCPVNSGGMVCSKDECSKKPPNIEDCLQQQYEQPQHVGMAQYGPKQNCTTQHSPPQYDQQQCCTPQHPVPQYDQQQCCTPQHPAPQYEPKQTCPPQYEPKQCCTPQYPSQPYNPPQYFSSRQHYGSISPTLSYQNIIQQKTWEGCTADQCVPPAGRPRYSLVSPCASYIKVKGRDACPTDQCSPVPVVETNMRQVHPTESGCNVNVKSKSCCCVSRGAGTPGNIHFLPPPPEPPVRKSLSDSRFEFDNKDCENRCNASTENALEQMCRTVGLLTHQIRELMCKIMDKHR